MVGTSSKSRWVGRVISEFVLVDVPKLNRSACHVHVCFRLQCTVLSAIPWGFFSPLDQDGLFSLSIFKHLRFYVCLYQSIRFIYQSIFVSNIGTVHIRPSWPHFRPDPYKDGLQSIHVTTVRRLKARTVHAVSIHSLKVSKDRQKQKQKRSRHEPLQSNMYTCINMSYNPSLGVSQPG